MFYRPDLRVRASKHSLFGHSQVGPYDSNHANLAAKLKPGNQRNTTSVFNMSWESTNANQPESLEPPSASGDRRPLRSTEATCAWRLARGQSLDDAKEAKGGKRSMYDSRSSNYPEGSHQGVAGKDFWPTAFPSGQRVPSIPLPLDRSALSRSPVTPGCPSPSRDHRLSVQVRGAATQHQGLDSSPHATTTKLTPWDGVRGRPSGILATTRAVAQQTVRNHGNGSVLSDRR